MVIGYNNETQGRKTSLTKRVDIFNCYHNPDTINSPSLVYVEEKTHYEQATNVVSQTDSNGLMNSSWSMYCHDTHHSGRSPYSTVDTWNEIWNLETYGWAEGGPTIDKNGTIYIGAYSLYAVYPNGTLKWKYDTIFSIVSSPAIDENACVIG